jgi:hypothetical protein
MTQKGQAPLFMIYPFAKQFEKLLWFHIDTINGNIIIGAILHKKYLLDSIGIMINRNYHFCYYTPYATAQRNPHRWHRRNDCKENWLKFNTSVEGKPELRRGTFGVVRSRK